MFSTLYHSSQSMVYAEKEAAWSMRGTGGKSTHRVGSSRCSPPSSIRVSPTTVCLGCGCCRRVGSLACKADGGDDVVSKKPSPIGGHIQRPEITIVKRGAPNKSDTDHFAPALVYSSSTFLDSRPCRCPLPVRTLYQLVPYALLTRPWICLIYAELNSGTF